MAAVRARLVTLYFCVVLASLGVPATYGQTVPWLYDVEVPVADQGSDARREAARTALLQLLTRLSGLIEVPDEEAVNQALLAPELYYNGFRYVEGQVIDELGEVADELRLRVQFERNAVQGLLRAAGLPIWRGDRPRVLVWLGVESAQERRIVGADDASDLVSALAQRARQRGLPMVLPLLDLEDQLAVEPAAVWGRLEGVLRPASERYGADVLLLGRVQPLTGGAWTASWELWLDDEQLPLTQRSADLPELGALGADFVADELARRYAVLAREAQGISLAVHGIRGPGDYGGLLRYLNQLEFVDDVAVIQVFDDQVDLLLVTRADIEQLLSLFAVDRTLKEVALERPSGYDAELAWQYR
jgi:hypothetical protein